MVRAGVDRNGDGHDDLKASKEWTFEDISRSLSEEALTAAVMPRPHRRRRQASVGRQARLTQGPIASGLMSPRARRRRNGRVCCGPALRTRAMGEGGGWFRYASNPIHVQPGDVTRWHDDQSKSVGTANAVVAGPPSSGTSIPYRLSNHEREPSPVTDLAGVNVLEAQHHERLARVVAGEHAPVRARSCRRGGRDAGRRRPAPRRHPARRGRTRRTA